MIQIIWDITLRINLWLIWTIQDLYNGLSKGDFRITHLIFFIDVYFYG